VLTLQQGARQHILHPLDTTETVQHY